MTWDFDDDGFFAQKYAVVPDSLALFQIDKDIPG